MTDEIDPEPTLENLIGSAGLAAAIRPLEQAATLPASAFTSPEVYQREFDQIFAREWLCAGRVDQVGSVGDYFTLDLLGQRLVVVRGKDGEVRVLSRVCRHRAAEVVNGAGNARSFQCPYHAWTYQLDGRLVGAPLMEEAKGFDRAACRLPQIRSEIWEGWIFVNFDAAAASLGPQLAPLSTLLSDCKMSEMVAVEIANFDSYFNWKVLTDNFMEAYHHIAIHRDTLEPHLPAKRSYVPDSDGPYAALYMPNKNQEMNVPFDGLIAAAVFPFHLFAPTPEGLTWYQILPVSLGRFTLRIFSCFPRKVLEDPAQNGAVRGMQELTKTIHHEDIRACEAVWAGLNDSSFESGPLSAYEKAIWQFNQWWIERMRAPA